MIKKTSLTILTLLSLASPALYAADQPFTGPAIAGGLSLGTISNKVDPSSPYKAVVINQDGTWYSGTNDKTSAVPMIDFSWNVPIAPTWVAGVGANIELGKQSGPEKIISDSRFMTASTSFDMKRQASIYGLVGKQLGDNWLLYGKLGYHQAKVDAKLSGTRLPNFKNSYTLNGTGFGIGAIYALQKGLELRMEGEYIAYNGFTQKIDNVEVVSNKPAVARVNVMLGYRF